MNSRSLAFLVAALLGCDVGEVGPVGGTDASAGGGAGGGGGAPTGGSGELSEGSCTPASTDLPNGNHNAGQDCMLCHDGSTSGAPVYTVAGTLFANGSTPLVGATVFITDSASNSFTLVTASNGNFYSGSAVTLPLTALGVADCDAYGSGEYMNSEMPVASTTAAAVSQGASCNNCHVAGQDAPPLHLP